MTEAAKKPEPQGVLAIWTDPAGRVIATRADLERSGFSGFHLWESQRIRARDRVMREAVMACASPVMTGCLSSYVMDQIAEEMLRKGHRITIRAIGYEGDIKENLER